jgi:hypothetical protein
MTEKKKVLCGEDILRHALRAAQDEGWRDGLI